MYDVVALGELLIDFTTQSIDSDGYPTMAAHPGGAPANFLAAIAKFGGKVGMLGKVGTDTFGKLLTNTLRGAGIETKGLVAADDVFTTLAFVTRKTQPTPRKVTRATPTASAAATRSQKVMPFRS